jgi:hypothetical protein
MRSRPRRPPGLSLSAVLRRLPALSQWRHSSAPPTRPADDRSAPFPITWTKSTARSLSRLAASTFRPALRCPGDRGDQQWAHDWIRPQAIVTIGVASDGTRLLLCRLWSRDPSASASTPTDPKRKSDFAATAQAAQLAVLNTGARVDAQLLGDGFRFWRARGKGARGQVVPASCRGGTACIQARSPRASGARSGAAIAQRARQTSAECERGWLV